MKKKPVNVFEPTGVSLRMSEGAAKYAMSLGTIALLLFVFRADLGKEAIATAIPWIIDLLRKVF